MGLLVAEVEKQSQVNVVKLLIKVYLTIIEVGYCEADCTLLAFYILYGPGKDTDARLRAEYYTHLPLERATHAIYKIRSKLKKLGLLIPDTYTMELYVIPELLDVFADKTRLAAVLKFSYHEL